MSKTSKKKLPKNRKDRLVTLPPIVVTGDPKLLLDPKDPFYRKPRRVPGLDKIKSYRGKSRKVLTKRKRSGIIERVKKLNRKDDKTMAHDKTNKSKKLGVLKSIAWLAFAAQQAFAGYVLLSNFDNYFVVATAFVSLGLAGITVVTHFAKAHK